MFELPVPAGGRFTFDEALITQSFLRVSRTPTCQIFDFPCRSRLWGKGAARERDSGPGEPHQVDFSFQMGSGYGDPDARKSDEHRLQSAREEAKRRFREYEDLQRSHMEMNLFKLQRSQTRATWASFAVAVAAAVGIATVVNIIIATVGD